VKYDRRNRSLIRILSIPFPPTIGVTHLGLFRKRHISELPKLVFAVEVLCFNIQTVVADSIVEKEEERHARGIMDSTGSATFLVSVDSFAFVRYAPFGPYHPKLSSMKKSSISIIHFQFPVDSRHPGWHDWIFRSVIGLHIGFDVDDGTAIHRFQTLYP